MPERREVTDRLLRDGAMIVSPDKETVEAAWELVTKGLVTTTMREFVRCANPEDPDFPPYNRHCRGRVYVEDGLDEAGHDFKCPDCERPVFPFRARKRRHRELQVRVLSAGVLAFLGSRMPDAEEIAPGRYRVDHDGSPVEVCVLECCDETGGRSVGRGVDTPTLYVATHRGSAERTSRELRQSEVLSLSDLLHGQTTVAAAIERLLSDTSTAGANGAPPVPRAPTAGTPRFRAPRTIEFRGNAHDCPGLTGQQIKFLRVAMPNAETSLELLFGAGAIWEQTYTGVARQRDRITQLISRTNRRLAACSPKLGIYFSLRSGETFITRIEPMPADK